jgi:NAD(P)-dependent dehydrogenase (short-subunit alcohol dehydrogenase family)
VQQPLLDFSLSGRVVVVTGASSGIGAQAARAVSRAGARVLVVARREGRLRELSDSLENCTALALDVSASDAAERLTHEITTQFGRVDALINAAGITNVATAMRERTEDVRRVLEVNVVASFSLSQAVARLMREGKEGGSIINVASVIASMSEPLIPQAGYASSKGAVVSMSREMAVQWARYGIRVNTLAPGWFPTEMTQGLTDDADRLAAFESKIPLGRLGGLEEIDGPVIFLASRASSYMTGQVLCVDGGVSVI